VRGGKSSAVNLGLQYAQGEFVVTVDADTTFEPEAVLNILTGFSQPDVVAVSGNIRVGNWRENLLTRLQAIHYLISISVGRIASSWMNILLIVSGAFGAFQTEVARRVGGWDVGPGEDADMTIKARKNGGRISFQPKAICFTRVPATLVGFIRQQRRWSRSIVRLRLRKHAALLCPWQVSFSGWTFWATLDILLFQVVLGYSFVFYLVWLWVYFRQIMLPVLFSGYLLYLASNFVQFFIAWLLSERKGQDARLFVYLPLYPLFCGYFLRFIRVFAYTEELLLRASYRDPQVPRKVLDQVVRW